MECDARYLSSGPPSFRAIFRKEKIVPKMSLASSWALSRAGRALAGPRSTTTPLLVPLESDTGLVFEVAVEEVGLSLAQSLL